MYVLRSFVQAACIVVSLVFLAAVSLPAQAKNFHESEIELILERSAYIQRPGEKPYWIISQHNQATVQVIEYECHSGCTILDLDWYEQIINTEKPGQFKIAQFFHDHLPTVYAQYLKAKPAELFRHQDLWVITPTAERVDVFKDYLNQILKTRGTARLKMFNELKTIIADLSMEDEERKLYQSILGAQSPESIKPSFIECAIDLSGLRRFFK